MKTKRDLKWHIILILLVIILFYPLVYMISTSLKSLNQIFTTGLNILPMPPTLKNFVQVFDTVPVGKYLYNSFFVAVIVMSAKIVTSIMASYALVFMDFKYKNAMFYFFTLTMFVPFSVIMIPNYLTINRFGLLNTLIGVALPQMADAMGIFRIRQAMRSVPKSLVEAARLDKVSHFTALIKIVLPLVKPSVIAMCIFFFINSWNEYFWPLLILKEREMATITLSMQQFLSSEGGNAWGSSMALAAIATAIPLLLYLFFQRYIISSFMSSGIKE